MIYYTHMRIVFDGTGSTCLMHNHVDVHKLAMYAHYIRTTYLYRAW